VLLCLDVGNTTIHLGVYREAELLAYWDISNNRDRTADELGLLLVQFLASRGFEPSCLQGAAIASVVPMVTGTIATAVNRSFGVEPFILGPGADTGIVVRYENPMSAPTGSRTLSAVSPDMAAP